MIHPSQIDPTPFTIDEITLVIKLRDLTGHDDWVVSRSPDSNAGYENHSGKYIRLCRQDSQGTFVDFRRVEWPKDGWMRWDCYPRTMNLPPYF